MCLNINKFFNKEKKDFLKESLCNKEGYIKGWKVFVYDSRRIQLVTPYQSNFVSTGVNRSDRESKAFTFQEKTSLEIHNGCHFFLNENTARKLIRRKSRYDKFTNYVQRVIYYKPEDLVAVGRFYNKVSMGNDSGVVMQYKLY